MRIIIVLTVAIVLVSGCTADQERESTASETSPVEASSSVASMESTATAAPPSPSPTPPPELDDLGLADGEFPSLEQVRELGSQATCHYLGEEWCVDSNGNGWPDVLEEAAGRAPDVDECQLTADCGLDLEDFLAEAATNTLFILDASGSMAGSAGGGVDKMTAAKEALVEYVLGTPDSVDLGLVVYGHRGDNSDGGRAESCAGIEPFAEIGGLTAENVEATVGQFNATGWTPIGASLDAAGPLLVDAADADAAEGVEAPLSRVILVSDGLETCDGDPVASARALTELGVEVVVDVVGFDIAEADRAALEEVAVVGGGTYYDAASNAALSEVLSRYRQQWSDALEASQCFLQASNEANSCRRQLSNAIFSATRGTDGLVSRARDEDRARGAFMDRWVSQLSREQDEASGAASQEQYERFSELSAQAEEARRRIGEARGASQKVTAATWGMSCRWAQPGPWVVIG